MIRQFCLLITLPMVLAGCTEGGNGSVPAESPPTPEQPADEGDMAPDNPASIILQEGATPLQLVIPVTRVDDNADTLRLAVDQAYRDRYPALSIVLEPDTLPPGTSEVELTLGYALSVAPIQPIELSIPLQISGGAELQQQLLAVQVNPTTAPDVYLLIGQSNMIGGSEHGSKMSQAGQPDAADPRIQQLNVTDSELGVFNSPGAFSDPALNVGSPIIIAAQDPLHDELPENQSVKSGDQIGPALSFAKAALPDTDSNILLVPAAWGGSGFCGNKELMTSWNTSDSDNPVLGGTGLYHRAITRTNIALEQSSGILRGILWHQGEHDTEDDTCASLYAENLQQLVRAFRQNIAVDARGSAARGVSSDVPFILGTLSAGEDARGDFSITSASRQTVDNVHRSIASLVGHAGFSNHDDLVPPAYPCGDTSCIHFGATAYREMGQRYYLALKRVNGQ